MTETAPRESRREEGGTVTPDLGALAVQGTTVGCPTCRRWVGVLLYDADGYLQCRRCRNGRTGIVLPKEEAS